LLRTTLHFSIVYRMALKSMLLVDFHRRSCRPINGGMKIAEK
ncbi:Uncharacterized protein APZ42_009649, partial [Daphnia magna]